MNEEAFMFGQNKSIVGVLTHANSRKYSNTAVILLNAGLIHHVGPSRLHVIIARELALRGVNTVRFDFSGVGDSSVRTDAMPVLEVAFREPQEVMNDLGKMGFERFIVMGICSGAYCSFKTACKYKNVIGAVLINPQDFVDVPDWSTQAWARRYWNKSIFNTQAWINLFTGRINYRRLFETLFKQFTGLFSGKNKEVTVNTKIVKGEIDKLVERDVKLLFVLSEQDVSVEKLSFIIGKNINEPQESGSMESTFIPGADHLFTRIADQRKLVDIISKWTTKVVTGK